MYFRFTVFNIATLAVMALTVVMMWARFRFQLEKTWLLIYYLFAAAYWVSFRDTLDLPWLLGGAACGVFLRFEFLGGWPLKGVRGLEFVFFAYVLWKCTVLLSLFPG